MQLGLRGQSITFCIALLAGTCGLLSAILCFQDYRETMREMELLAQNQGDLLSRTSEPLVLLNDIKELRAMLRASCVKDLVYLQCLDKSGKELASYSRHQGFVPPVQGNLRDSLTKANAQIHPRLVWTSEALTVLVPIHQSSENPELRIPERSFTETTHVLGYVRLVYSLDQFNQMLVSHIWTGLIVTAVVIGFGVALTVIMVRKLLNPIENLATTAWSIATGDLTRRARDDAKGEIGVLARAFNHMADVVCSHAENLEHEVVERTAALADALHRTEAANVAKSEFLANMSHEIRTPMTAILGYTDLISDGCPARCEYGSNTMREALDTIQRNGQHLLQLINDILDLSKIEAGKLELEVVPFSCVQFVSEIKSLMRVRAEIKQLSFKVEFATPLPEAIETDPTRLRQILVNLIGNAIKFTQTGHVQITVHYGDRAGADHLDLFQNSHGDLTGTPRELDTPYLRFDVTDTGIGMTEEQVDRLFQPFAQADSSMARRFGGTGLGLNISRRLAQMLGGSIYVSSRLNQGSMFQLVIPVRVPEGTGRILQPDDAVVTGPDPFESKPAHAQLNDPLRCRVLLAEDGPDNQRLITWVLKNMGCEVIVAANGKIAVESTQQALILGTPFDIILMDMQMPVMDGYSATRELRSLGYSGVIVALTAHAMSGDRQKCLDCGCNDYAVKPIDRAQLYKIIQAHAADRQTAPQTAAI